MRKSLDRAAAVFSGFLLATPPAALAQTVGTADIVNGCGVPNSTYTVGRQRPVTQTASGLGCNNGLPVFGQTNGQIGVADVVAACGAPNSRYIAGKVPRPVTMDTTGTLC